MQIVSRINLPKSSDVSGVYLQCNDGAINYTEGAQEVLLHAGGVLSLNSYFNSFYEKFYTEYTNIDSIYYLLSFEGDFQVSVYRERYGQTDRELLGTHDFKDCQLSKFVKLELPSIEQSESNGRIYLEMTCLSEQGLFKGGLLATDKEKLREISLAIISCTFKKEVYIKKTVNTVLEDEFLQKKDFKIFVVDNGRTLEQAEFNHKNIQLIQNRNVGGSGGFARGLVEALKDDTYSHFVFMDDDIDLDSECIYRLFSLYEYAKFDFAVAGSMLDLYKKHVLYEAGAMYSRNYQENSAHSQDYEDTEFAPYSLAPLKHKLDLKESSSLNAILNEDDIDYGAFWFFSFSKEIVAEIGLPMPFFIKIDDVEFSLRIKERLGRKIVAFPSIAVWHEPFYAKFPIWDIYYYVRNSLITHAIRGSLGYLQAIRYTTIGFIYSLAFFEYNQVSLIVKAFEDFLKGPNVINNNDPVELHSQILKLSKSYDNQHIQRDYSPPIQAYPKSSPGRLRKLISLLTLNGQLLPNFLTSNDDAFIWHGPGYSGQRSRALGKKRVLIFNETNNCLFQNERNKLASIKLLTKWLKFIAQSSLKWNSVSREWKKAAKEMSSTSFWQQYLELENKT